MTGRKVAEAEPRPKPIHTPSTSSKPVERAMRKVRRRETPATSKGAMMTIPSGMFCKAMPKETDQSVAEPVAALMLTPAAMPSGSLCNAIAMTKRRTWLRVLLLRCSSGSRPVMVCR